MLWPECHKLVSDKFSEIKKAARKFYVDKNIIEILKEINKYTDDDIKEMLHVEHGQGQFHGHNNKDAF